SLLDSHVRDGALITDAGSTKVQIAATAARHISRCQFLGGHPMAGKETRGVETAEADLFVGRPYVLTPMQPQDLNKQAARQFIDWIRAIGAIPISMTPKAHDRTVARTSHLPQLASTALAAALADMSQKAVELSVSGSGLRDSTRLALSPFEMWSEI